MFWRSPALIVCGLVICSVTGFPADSPAKHAKSETLAQRLDHIIIPKIEFHEATFREALETLLHEAQRLDPKGRGINTTLRLSAPPLPASGVGGAPGLPPFEPAPAGAQNTPGAPGIPVSPGGFVSLAEPMITVSLSKIPFSEALSYITGLAKLKWRVEDNVVQIVSESEPDPIRRKTFRILPGLLPESNEAERREIAERHALLVKEPRQFLAAGGVELPKDGTLSLNDDGTLLTVQATDAELGKIGAVLDGLTPERYLEIGRSCAASERTRRKASGIVLPTSKFANVPLNAALTKLQSEGSLHDSVPAKAERGVKIRFEPRKPYREEERETSPAIEPPKVPGLDPAADTRYEQGTPEKWVTVIKTDPIPTVTGSARNISLLEAVSTLARMAGYRAYIRADEIVVHYPDAWDDVLTKEYAVPPGLALGEAPKAGENGKQIVNRLFTGQEKIPEPWNAIYLGWCRSLIVQMREEATIDAMDAAIDRAWFDYFEAAKKK
jgi:hypothetical protein